MIPPFPARTVRIVRLLAIGLARTLVTILLALWVSVLTRTTLPEGRCLGVRIMTSNDGMVLAAL